MLRRCLGRLEPSAEQRARALPVKNYLTKPLPPAPKVCRNSDGAAIGMWGNDRFGNCTVAALANHRAIIAEKYMLGRPATTETKVVDAYFKLTPGGRDTGLVEHDVLNAGMNGLDLGGDLYMVATWVTVDLDDEETCKSLINLFGALYIGIALPNSAQTQDVWTPTTGRDAAPNSWGGHAALIANYTENDYGIITWGKEQLCDRNWFNKYVVEGHCLLDIGQALVTGMAWDDLVADLAQVAK